MKIEVWYSPKYNEFLLREFDEWESLSSVEYSDDFDISFNMPDDWEYVGEL